MAMDEKAKPYIQRWESLQSEKSSWQAHLEDIRKLVRPNAGEFAGKLSLGAKRTLDIFDDTAVLANISLTSFLGSYLTPMNMRWFNTIIRDQALMKRDDVLLYLEEIADAMYFHMAIPECSFYTQGDEAIGDICSLGTAAEMLRWNPWTRTCVFKTHPLASLSFAENDFNVLDTVYRECEFTCKQAKEKFGKNISKNIQKKLEKNPFDKVKFLHCVEPRGAFDMTKWDAKNMPFVSCWIDMEEKTVVGEGGYRKNPYIVSRWSTISTEINGRSPAMGCLARIKVVNEKAKLRLQREQLELAPPTVYDADGFDGDLQMYPWAVNRRTERDAEAKPIFTLPPAPEAMQAIMEDRQFILQAFFIDKLMLQKNNVEMRQVEVLQRIDEGLKSMGPQIGRLQKEMLGPKISALYNMMLENGLFNHIQKPAILNDYKGRLEIEYVSPAAKAQLASKATSIQRFLETLGQIAQFNPDAFDIVDAEKLGAELAIQLDVSRKVLRSADEMEELKNKKEQERAVMMASKAGLDMSGAAKNFASARKDMALAA